VRTVRDGVDVGVWGSQVGKSNFKVGLSSELVPPGLVVGKTELQEGVAKLVPHDLAKEASLLCSFQASFHDVDIMGVYGAGPIGAVENANSDALHKDREC
jgi:hypothetical protein